MSTNVYAVHGASSEPGVQNCQPADAPESANSLQTSAQVTDTTPLKKDRRRGRKMRVTNNQESTVFSSNAEKSKVRTFLRCTYHKNVKSHETLFGEQTSDTSSFKSKARRQEPAPDTQKNLFGDDTRPRSVIVKPQLEPENTFDDLFGATTLSPICPRLSEEDTHDRLFGMTHPVSGTHCSGPHENTQDNLFGPPTPAPPPPSKSNSRSQDTQMDLFGPPLPLKIGQPKPGDRTSLGLFGNQAKEEPSKPYVMTRAGKINAASQEKLFGKMVNAPTPPPVKEDTRKKLFGPNDFDPTALIAQYEQNKYNPITGEGRSEKHTTSQTTTKPVTSKRAPTPFAYTSTTSNNQPSSRDDEMVHQGARKPFAQRMQHWNKVNTITGNPTSYMTPGDCNRDDALRRPSTSSHTSALTSSEPCGRASEAGRREDSAKAVSCPAS